MSLEDTEGYVGRCVADGCGIPMLSEWRWERIGRSHKVGFAAHRGKGLCSKHFHRKNRTGTTAYTGPKRSSILSPADVPVYRCTKCKGTMCSQIFRRRWDEMRDAHRQMGTKDLCHRCYQAAVRVGDRPERQNRSADEVLDEWVWLRDDGVTDVKIAAGRIGMTWKALDKALYRARKRGDQRGSLVPFAHDMRRNAA